MNLGVKVGIGLITVASCAAGGLFWLLNRHVDRVNDAHARCYKYAQEAHLQLLADGQYFHANLLDRKALLWSHIEEEVTQLLATEPKPIQETVVQHIKYDLRNIVVLNQP